MAAKRVYEAWKGSNIFILGGRLIFGPDARSLLVTLLLITVPVILFCIFVAAHLRHRSPGYSVLVLALVFTLYVLVLLFLTSARDPGIIPRNARPPDEDTQRSKEVMVKGVPVRVKYCDTCMVYRPPRCSHCSICNNCVERFDHHCPWVGQCIGLRNYRYFFMFVSSSTVLCVYVLGLCGYYIKVVMREQRGSVWRAMRESPASVVLMAYCFISLWFVGGLTAFHLYLIASNQTTYENFRYRADDRVNVYDQGCLRNFAQVFCTKGKPSRNKFRAFLKEEEEEHPRASLDLESRSKVGDDLEIGEDLFKISQRRNVDEDDIRTNGPQLLDSELNRAPTIRSETRHSTWEIAPDVTQ